MSALKEEVVLNDDIKLVFDFTEKPNRTNLTPHEDRAVVAKLRADLVLPTNKILTVDIDFDTDSGYHNNTMMIMDEFGMEVLAHGFEAMYGEEQANKVREAWAEKQKQDDPRKPTYLLVQKPQKQGELPKVFAACGGRQHPPQEAPESII